MEITYKICSRCGREKKRTRFDEDSRTYDGLRSICSVCAKKEAAQGQNAYTTGAEPTITAHRHNKILTEMRAQYEDELTRTLQELAQTSARLSYYKHIHGDSGLSPEKEVEKGVYWQGLATK